MAARAAAVVRPAFKKLRRCIVVSSARGCLIFAQGLPRLYSCYGGNSMQPTHYFTPRSKAMNCKFGQTTRTATLTAIAALVAMVSASAAQPGQRPNIVFMYADDWRWDCLGVVQIEQGDKA